VLDILIIDDEPVYAEPTRRALSKVGFSVRICYSIGEGRRIVKNVPRAIILDILFRPSQYADAMEPLGYDFLVELKQNPRTRGIPVIMLTVISDPDMATKCKKAGAAKYITKGSGAREVIHALAGMGIRPRTRLGGPVAHENLDSRLTLAF
jgi:CheY-like chemotaxis protein